MADQDKKQNGEAAKDTADAEMKIEGEAAPKEPEKPAELETDAIEDKKAKISGVAFAEADSTLNLVASRNMVSTFSESGMHLLLAGARANAGIKNGRYLFEIRIIEMHGNPDFKAPATYDKPRPVVRVGFSISGSSLLMNDASDSSIGFDMDGGLFVGKRKIKATQRFRKSTVVGILLNLDASSPNKNTISLFSEGARICDPQPLPDNLTEKTLFPAICFKNASIQVNFGPTPLAPLPFKCHMVGAASKTDAEMVAEVKSKQSEIVFPVGLPDQGFFDWVDAFLEKHPNYIELSDRMIVDWAVKSGVRYRAPNTMDKPKLDVPQIDDNSCRRILQQIASISNRNFVVSELQANLLVSERQASLKRFTLPNFKKIARVVIGEPSDEHKAKVHELMKQEKLKKMELALKKKQLEEERKKKAEEFRKLRSKEKSDAEVTEESKEQDVKTEEPLVVELTDEEKAQWYRKHACPEMAEGMLAKHYANFCLPSKEEGFDQIVYEWQNEAASATLLKKWVSAKKMMQRVDDLKPGEAFTQASAAWAKTLSDWKNLQIQWRDPLKKKALLAKRKEAKTKEAEEKGEAVAEDMEIDFEDLDLESVTEVKDIGNGQPLFSNFNYEDWQLLAVRRELTMLVHSFQTDLNDPERTGFSEKDLTFYYNKYFKRNFSLKNFNCDSLQALVDLIPDTITISSKNSFLEALHPQDVDEGMLVKIVETGRRDRQRRLDAGDESAELKFPRGSYAPMNKPGAPWHGAEAGKAAGKGPRPPQQRPPAYGRPVGAAHVVGQKRPAPPTSAPGVWAPKQPRNTWGGSGHW